jgi:hypothetical protein
MTTAGEPYCARMHAGELVLAPMSANNDGNCSAGDGGPMVNGPLRSLTQRLQIECYGGAPQIPDFLSSVNQADRVPTTARRSPCYS